MAVLDSVLGHQCELTSTANVQLGFLTLYLGLLEKFCIQTVTFGQQNHTVWHLIFLMHFWNSHLPNMLYFGRGKMEAEQMSLRRLLMRDRLSKNCSRPALHSWARRGFFSRPSLHPSFQKGLDWPATDLSPICLSETAVDTWENWIPTPDRAWKGMALPLAFTDQANKAARSLTSLQPRDWDACPHCKELCSIAFIRYLCRGLALWTCALKAQSLSGCAKMLGKQIASVQCDSCWNVSNAVLITLSVGSQKLLDMH